MKTIRIALRYMLFRKLGSPTGGDVHRDRKTLELPFLLLGYLKIKYAKLFVSIDILNLILVLF